MKKHFLLICIIACAAVSSCKKPENPVCCSTPPPVGVYGQKDGKDWRATAITDTTIIDTIYVYAKTDSDMLKLKLVKSNLNNDATYYVTAGARGKLTYVLDKAAANDIKVDYGKGEKAGHISNIWVTSNFSLMFKLSSPTGNVAFDSKRVAFSNSTIHYGLQN